MNDSSRVISTKIRKAASYHMVPATGTWGVFTGDGNVLCNFVVDYQAMPEEIEFSVDSNGATRELNRIFSDSSIDPSDLYERELQVGVLMTRQAAKAIGKWLIDFADGGNAPFEDSAPIDGELSCEE